MTSMSQLCQHFRDPTYKALRKGTDCEAVILNQKPQRSNVVIFVAP